MADYATAEKIARLPQWVRRLLKSKDDQIEELKRNLALAEGQINDGVWAFRTHWDQPDRPVAGEFDTVEVRLAGYDDGLGRERKVQLRLSDDGKLSVRGGRPLSIHPMASNHLELSVVDR